MKQQRAFFTWGLANKVIVANRAHPQEQARVKLMKKVFLTLPDSVCWWCGMRPLDERAGGIQADHIAPFIYHSPMAIACKTCNRQRKRILPHPERMGRLFHSENVVRSCSAPEMLRWCQYMANEIFGGYANGIQLLLAQGSGRKPVRNEQGKVCERSNKMIQTAGFLPPEI